MNDLAVESAVEDVIRQFADPLAFFRELIQNSLDAGSGEVAVRVDYDDERELGLITVTDWGEGMTREIIETQLVRLFDSAKEADLTKIGKFGIGFISVLAVEPELVVVESGRDGEYWRLLLHPDRRYELFELEHPVEGTEVRLYVRQSEAEFLETFREGGRRRVRRWCRFVDVPVLFDGEDVRRPFELDGLVVAKSIEEGTRVVVALCTDAGCDGHYFNAGLALQSVRSRWPHVAFLLDSRYLEHTLARDRVLEDKNFYEALQRLDETIRVRLRGKVVDALRRWPTDPDRRWDWVRLCSIVLAAFADDIVDEVRFPTIDGRLLGPDEVREARSNNRLMLTRGRAHFATRMPDDYTLLDVRPDSAPADLLRETVERDVPRLEDVWVMIPTTVARADHEARLLEEFEANIRTMGASPRYVGFGEFDYPYSGLDEQMFVTVDDRSVPTHRADVRPTDPFGDVDEVLINISHPLVIDAVDVARHEPEWAGYIVAKAAALATEAIEEQRLSQHFDARLALESLERRQARLGVT